jgi:hypothetical protein
MSKRSFMVDDSLRIQTTSGSDFQTGRQTLKLWRRPAHLGGMRATSPRSLREDADGDLLRRDSADVQADRRVHVWEPAGGCASVSAS